MLESTPNENNAELQNAAVTLQSIATKRALKTYCSDEPITYEFTQDPALLHQYYLLREARYRRHFKTDEYNGSEDFHDKLSHILIAHRGRLCIGGGRLTIREGDEAWYLPMENDEFNLRKSLPDLPLNKVRHAEVSRFAVLEDSDNDVVYKISKIMIDMATRSNIHYVFIKSTYQMAKKWQLLVRRAGIRSTQIMENINPAERTLSADVTRYLLLLDFTRFCCDDSMVKKVVRPYSNQISESIN